MESKKRRLSEVSSLLNAQHSDIELTEELEQDRSLPFLDILVKRPLIGDNAEVLEPMEISVYRKKTHSERYLHYKSLHPFNMKKNVVKGLWL